MSNTIQSFGYNKTERYIRIILILILLLFSVEYLGNGQITVYRVTIFPLSIIGLLLTFSRLNNRQSIISGIVWILYFIWYAFCMMYLNDNYIMPLTTIPLALFICNAIPLKGVHDIDYPSIMLWYGLPHLIVYFFGTPNYAYGRFAGLHNDPNFCGIFLTVSILSIFFILRRKEVTKWKKTLLTLLLVLYVYLLLLTSSRGALIVVLAISAYALLLMIKKKYVKILFVIAIAVSGYFLINYIESLPSQISLSEDPLNYFLSRFKSDEIEGGSGRSQAWIIVLSRLIDGNHWFYPLGRESAMDGLGIRYTHNTWIDFMVENGIIVGGCLIITLLFNMIKGFSLIRKNKKNENEKSIYYLCLIILLQFFFLSAINQKIVWVFVFLLIAYNYNQPTINEYK